MFIIVECIIFVSVNKDVMRAEIKDGDYKRYFVAVVYNNKVVNLVWCSNHAQIQRVRVSYPKEYTLAITDILWKDKDRWNSDYQHSKDAARQCGCKYFCKDTLQGTDGIFKMARLTGVTPYEIRRSILKGWKSHNGHSYEKL